jgi:S1-C subfamily serine protease
VDLRGQVVGIPTLAAINPEAGTPAAGIGFAISSDRALFIARQLIASGHVSSTGRAYLGVRVAQSEGAPGVVVASVDRGTPAARSGIRAGEAIVSVDGRRTPTPQALATVLATKRPGQTVTLKLASPTAPARTVRVRLGQLPGS